MASSSSPMVLEMDESALQPSEDHAPGRRGSHGLLNPMEQSQITALLLDEDDNATNNDSSLGPSSFLRSSVSLTDSSKGSKSSKHHNSSTRQTRNHSLDSYSQSPNPRQEGSCLDTVKAEQSSNPSLPSVATSSNPPLHPSSPRRLKESEASFSFDDLPSLSPVPSPTTLKLSTSDDENRLRTPRRISGTVRRRSSIQKERRSSHSFDSTVGAFAASGRAFGERPSWAIHGGRRMSSTSDDSSSHHRNHCSVTLSRAGSFGPYEEPLEQSSAMMGANANQLSGFDSSVDSNFFGGDPLSADPLLAAEGSGLASSGGGGDGDMEAPTVLNNLGFETPVEVVLAGNRTRKETTNTNRNQTTVFRVAACLAVVLLLACFGGIAVAMGIGWNGETQPEAADLGPCSNLESSTDPIVHCRCNGQFLDIPTEVEQRYQNLQTMVSQRLSPSLNTASIRQSTIKAVSTSSCDEIRDLTLLTMAMQNRTDLEIYALTVTFSEVQFTKQGWSIDAITQSNNSVCSWPSISCDDEDHVVGVDLTNQDLLGSLPREIGLLTDLTALLLSTNNGLSGTIVPEIGLLTNLVYFSVGFSQIEGSIPTEVGRLHSLENFNASYTLLNETLPTEIGNLRNLVRLDLNNNAINGIVPTELSYLTLLKDLHLEFNGFTGSISTELGSLTSLTSLGLGETSLFYHHSIPSEVWSLSNLRSLMMAGLTLVGTIPGDSLANLTHLKHLYLQSNEISGSIPSEIGALTNLVELSVSTNRLTGSLPSEIGLLTELREFLLSNNYHIGGVVPTELYRLTDIAEFDLKHTSVSGNLDPLCDKVDTSVTTIRIVEGFVNDGRLICSCCKQES